MPMSVAPFAIETTGVTMWRVALTFQFVDGKPKAAISAETLVDASAGLPAGAYTTLRTYGGNGVVRLDRHVRRLVESLPADDAARAALDAHAVRSALAHALRETGHPESRL